MTITKYSSKHIIILPVLFSIFSFLLTTASGSLLSIMEPLNTNLLLFFSIPGHFLMLSYVFIAIGRKSIFSNELELHINWKDIIPGVIFGILTIFTASIISLILPVSQSPIHEFMFNSINPILIIYILFTSIIAPFVEELVFRGFIWRILEKKNISRYLILLITSILFAAMHMDINRFPALLSGGLIYGLLRMRTGTAGRSIVAHITNNFIVTFLTFILPFIL